MPRLHVIIASTRPTRVGLRVGQWFVDRAREHGKFEVVLVDLKEVNLPAMDEPRHPMLRQYEHEHTKRWSASVEAADAYVFVTPEYNFGPPPALMNAFDFVYREWNCKPAGFVSYGGVSGGLRSVQMTKLVLTAMKVMPLPEAVTIPFVGKQLDPSGAFLGGAPHDEAAAKMLDELLRWSDALTPLRVEKR